MLYTPVAEGAYIVVDFGRVGTPLGQRPYFDLREVRVAILAKRGGGLIFSPFQSLFFKPHLSRISRLSLSERSAWKYAGVDDSDLCEETLFAELLGAVIWPILRMPLLFFSHYQLQIPSNSAVALIKHLSDLLRRGTAH